MRNRTASEKRRGNKYEVREREKGREEIRQKEIRLRKIDPIKGKETRGYEKMTRGEKKTPRKKEEHVT